MRHLIDIEDLSLTEIDEILDLTDEIIADRRKFSDVMRGKKLATLFFEPSTRTRLSFEAAMLELGGNVLGFATAESSSAAKGESVSDTVRTVACYADIIAMRHPKEGAPMAAIARSKVPIVNAGDGGHNHPTQTLTDLTTIRRDKGRLNRMVVGLCGDLKFGRTVHSLITAMSRYEGVEFVLISPPELVVPDYLKRTLSQRGSAWREVQSLEDVMGGAGRALHDPRAEGALLQRGGLRAPEGQLHPDAREAHGREGRPHHPAPAAPRQRDLPPGGRRPARPLLRAGGERQIRAHGADDEADGGERINEHRRD